MTPEQRGPLWIRVAVLLLAAVQIPNLIRTAGDPSQSDFANYFVPARVLSLGGDVGALYDRQAFQTAMMEAGLPGLGSFIPHPPTNALWLLPLAGLAPSVAKIVWTFILCVALVSLGWSIARLFGVSLWQGALWTLAPTLAIRNGVAFGQPYLVLAALTSCGTLALVRERQVAGGFLLGLGAAFKPYALPLLLPLLHRERKRAVAGFGIGLAAPILLLFALAGMGPFLAFASKVAPWMWRGDIQDPFSPRWGSASALANHFLRFEADLNPAPVMNAPGLARFLGVAVSFAVLVIGVLAARRAMNSGALVTGIGIVAASSFAASPFGASYQLALLALPITALAMQSPGRLRAGPFLAWILVGSVPLGSTMFASFDLSPLGYLRFALAAALALSLAWPFVDRRLFATSVAIGSLLGLVGLPWNRIDEAWPRLSEAHGYSMMNPNFCGRDLFWFVPRLDGLGVEPRGPGAACAVRAGSHESGDANREFGVVSAFSDGSWDLFLAGGSTAARRITFSSANEIEPAVTPDGCGVVFASDQGRGLGSTALYRLDLSPFIESCEKPAPSLARP